MTTSTPDPSRPSAELARLIAGQIFLHACMSGMRMAAPLQALREGQSEAAVGLLMALFALTQVFLALPTGRYADKHGLKRPVWFAVIAATFGGLLAVAWPTFPVLCASALLTGGATGSASIALQRHVGRAAENATQRKRVFSWLAIGPAVSNFLGPFAAGLVIDHAGFRQAFLLLAVLPLLAWLWIRTAHELAPVTPPAKGVPLRTLDLFRIPTFRRLLFVNWIMASCWDVHTFIVPVLGHERGFSASVIGTILGAFAVAAAAVRIFIPVVAAHVREWAMVSSAMVATAVLFAVYPFMHAPVSMAMCSVLLGVALGSVQPMVMSMLHQVTPEHRHGEAVGMRMLVINAASVAMPLLFGATGALVGVAAVFWAMGLLVGGGTAVALRLKDDRTGE